MWERAARRFRRSYIASIRSKTYDHRISPLGWDRPCICPLTPQICQPSCSLGMCRQEAAPTYGSGLHEPDLAVLHRCFGLAGATHHGIGVPVLCGGPHGSAVATYASVGVGRGHSGLQALGVDGRYMSGLSVQPWDSVVFTCPRFGKMQSGFKTLLGKQSRNVVGRMIYGFRCHGRHKSVGYGRERRGLTI